MAAKRGKGVGKVLEVVKMYIPAGMASPSPPLGPALGQVNVFKHLCFSFYACYVLIRKQAYRPVVAEAFQLSCKYARIVPLISPERSEHWSLL